MSRKDETRLDERWTSATFFHPVNVFRTKFNYRYEERNWAITPYILAQVCRRSEHGPRAAQDFMKETDGGEGAFEHLPVMYPLRVDQLHRRARAPCAMLNNSSVICTTIVSRFSR